MPCRDFYDDHPQDYYGPMLKDRAREIEKLRKQISFAESALCAALSALESAHNRDAEQPDDFYDWIIFSDAGITKEQLVKWHIEHKRLDALHRAEEERKRQQSEKKLQQLEKRKQTKAAALAKLTDEEKKVLGVK